MIEDACSNTSWQFTKCEYCPKAFGNLWWEIIFKHVKTSTKWPKSHCMRHCWIHLEISLLYFESKFYRGLFLWVHLTRNDHWFTSWLEVQEPIIKYLNQWWPSRLVHVLFHASVGYCYMVGKKSTTRQIVGYISSQNNKPCDRIMVCPLICAVDGLFSTNTVRWPVLIWTITLYLEKLHQTQRFSFSQHASADPRAVTS